jgi:hypothetical protein
VRMPSSCKRMEPCAVQRDQASGGVEVRQENAFTEAQPSTLALQEIVENADSVSSVWGAEPEETVRAFVSAVRHLLPTPSSLQPQTGVLPATRWVDVAGRALRRTWTARLSSTIRRGAPSGRDSSGRFSSPSPTSGHPVSSELPLARTARPQGLVGTTPATCHCRWRPRFSGYEPVLGGISTQREVSIRCLSL